MFKYTQTICWLLPTNCLSVFDHLVGLVLKVIKLNRKLSINQSNFFKWKTFTCAQTRFLRRKKTNQNKTNRINILSSWQFDARNIFTEWNKPKYRSVCCWVPRGISLFLDFKHKTDLSTLFDYFSNIEFPCDVSKVFLFEVAVIYPTWTNIST